MVTLTTDYGTFAADTEKEAIAASRKAQREAERAERKKAESSAAADNDARRVAYQVYYAKHSPSCNKPTWMNMAKGYAPKPTLDEAGDFWILHVETAHGNATIQWYRSSWAMEGLLWDAGGSQCAIAFRDLPCGKIHVYAIGVHDGVSAIVGCPGIDMADFARDDSE